MAGSDISLSITQLQSLSRVLVRQKTSLVTNKYTVLTPDGVDLLYAKDKTGMINQMLDAKNRSFEIDILDTKNNEVMKFRRPFTMGQDKMDVVMCGKPVAVVRKELTFFKPVFNINDPGDKQVLRVKGPVSTTGECDFDLYTKDKKQIGAIRKKWKGLVSEIFTNADNYVIDFPADLDVRYKAAVIGTCFLIDFLYFET